VKVFSTENCIFHQFVKVFSLESFPLYGIKFVQDHYIYHILDATLT